MVLSDRNVTSAGSSRCDYFKGQEKHQKERLQLCKMYVVQTGLGVNPEEGKM
jgi:hypothetical protein